MKRIFMLSSYPLFSQAVESLLRPETELDIVGRETDVDRAMEHMKELRPDAVILDSGDPTCDPTQAVMSILRLRSGIRVIGLNLKDNTICIYRGEQRIARGVEDLVEAIKGQGFGSEPVSAEEWATLAASRSRVYGFLAAVYNRLPDDQFAESLSGPDLAGFLSSLAQRQELPEDMREGIRLIERFIRAYEGKPVDEQRADLAVERTRLLRGVKPGYGPPPPYESVYRGSDRQPATLACVAVAKRYVEAGVGLPDEMREQPDYIGLELDFMRHLTEKEANAWANDEPDEAGEYLKMEQAFLTEHIIHWIPHFCDAVIEQANLDFYRGIAKVTKGFIEDELQRIRAMSD